MFSLDTKDLPRRPLPAVCILAQMSILFLPFYWVFDFVEVIAKESLPDLYMKASDPKRMSDFYGLSKQLKFDEQLADAYVAKHGLSSAQVTALQKIWSLSEFSSSYAAMIGSTRSKVVYYINKVPFIISTILYGEPACPLYDTKADRMQRLLQETCAAFKQQMSPEMAQYFMNDYLACKKALKNKSAIDRITTTITVIRSLVKYIVTGLPALLISGRITSEYEKLYNQVEKLINNPLFFRSTQLEQLLRKR